MAKLTRVWNGSAWIEIAGTPGPTGPAGAAGTTLAQNSYTLVEEWLAGASGWLGWNNAGNGSPSMQNSTAAHPGVLRLSSGGTSTNNHRVFFPYGFAYSSVQAMTWVFNPLSNNTTTNATVQVGLTSDPTAPATGVWVEWNDTQAAWRVMLNGTATGTAVSSGSFGTIWLGLQMTRTSTTTMQVKLDYADAATNSGSIASATVTSSSGAETTAMLVPFARIRTANGTAKTIDVDAFTLQLGGIARTA